MISIYHNTDKHATVAHEVCPQGSSKLPQLLWYPKWPSFVGSGLGASEGRMPPLSSAVKGEASSGNQSSLMCQQGHPSENTSSSSWFHLPHVPSANPQLTRHSSVCSEYPKFSLMIVHTPAKRLPPILSSLTSIVTSVWVTLWSPSQALFCSVVAIIVRLDSKVF